MSDDSTRKWFRAVRRHAILESIALNALVTTYVVVVSSQYYKVLQALSRVHLHVDATQPSVMLGMLVMVVLPAICFVILAVGRIGREHLRLRELVAKDVRR